MSQTEQADFYTQKGYQMRKQQQMTGAMEDYLEMICRQARAEGYVRINFLAGRLNVRPSARLGDRPLPALPARRAPPVLLSGQRLHG